jgi:hypothetical protein
MQEVYLWLSLALALTFESLEQYVWQQARPSDETRLKQKHTYKDTYKRA